MTSEFQLCINYGKLDNRDGVSKQICSVRYFPNLSLVTIQYLFKYDKRRSSLAAVTPVQYKHDSKHLKVTLLTLL